MTAHLTPEEARRHGFDETKRHKFGAETRKQELTLDGIRFDSKLEISRYAQLKQMERAGLINQLRVHPSYGITLNAIPICKVELDFEYWDRNLNRWVYEDTKSDPTNTPYSRLKRKLLEAQFGFTVTLVKAQRKGWAR